VPNHFLQFANRKPPVVLQLKQDIHFSEVIDICLPTSFVLVQQEVNEEEAREELLREELVKEIEDKVGELRELEDADKEKETELV
jgi:hypothetical protein